MLHELAEWWLCTRAHYAGPDAERCADHIAAAILIPKAALHLAKHTMSEEFGDLAKVFRTSETCVALREAEVDSFPRAVITPQTIYALDTRSFSWGSESHLRRSARRPRPGLVKTRLGDDPRRVVLDVAG